MSRPRPIRFLLPDTLAGKRLAAKLGTSPHLPAPARACLAVSRAQRGPSDCGSASWCYWRMITPNFRPRKHVLARKFFMIGCGLGHMVPIAFISVDTVYPAAFRIDQLTYSAGKAAVNSPPAMWQELGRNVFGVGQPCPV
jgi:hypothetical protein